jgi:hypothetical protein
MAKKTDKTPIIVCQPKLLPKKQWIKAAGMAAAINPINEPARRASAIGPRLKPLELAVMTTKYWGPRGVDLTVSFLDNPSKPLRDRILSHMNAWSKTANVRFRYTAGHGQVRIARVKDDGYWSYVGTDVLSIPMSRQTLNLDSFTMSTPESEFVRVVRHEAGHTLGFPHEHMRKELVDLIDRAKAIAYFGRTQGWTRQEVEFQVLTPLSKGSLIASEFADPKSIMCYQIPGSITKNGQPIVGGTDIVASDRAFVGRIYPRKSSSRSTGSRPRARRARR